jgi:hypothetical protein
MIRPYGCPYGCVVRSPSYGRSGTRATGYGRIAANEFALTRYFLLTASYFLLHLVWYDLHNKTKRSTAMLRRLLSGLGIVEIIFTVVILLVVVFAIRQVLQ